MTCPASSHLSESPPGQHHLRVTLNRSQAPRPHTYSTAFSSFPTPPLLKDSSSQSGFRRQPVAFLLAQEGGTRKAVHPGTGQHEQSRRVTNRPSLPARHPSDSLRCPWAPEAIQVPSGPPGRALCLRCLAAPLPVRRLWPPCCPPNWPPLPGLGLAWVLCSAPSWLSPARPGLCRLLPALTLLPLACHLRPGPFLHPSCSLSQTSLSQTVVHPAGPLGLPHQPSEVHLDSAFGAQGLGHPSHCPLLSDSPHNGPWCCRCGGLWARAPRGHWMTPPLQDPATYDSRPSAPTRRATGRRCPLQTREQEPWDPPERRWLLASSLTPRPPLGTSAPSQTRDRASSHPLPLLRPLPRPW